MIFNLYSCLLPPIDFYDTNVRALTWGDEDVSMKAKENVCYEKKVCIDFIFFFCTTLPLPLHFSHGHFEIPLSKPMAAL